jgi:site-specific recombinase XerD
LFPSRRHSALSRDAIERLIGKYASAAAVRCSSLRGKTISPHVFRHSTAMSLLGAGVDTSVIAIWLGCAARRSCRIARQAGRDERSLSLDLMTDLKPKGIKGK